MQIRRAAAVFGAVLMMAMFAVSGARAGSVSAAKSPVGAGEPDARLWADG